MKKQILFALAAFLFSLSSAQATKPNFIVVFCDDLGYGDIGPFGSTKHATPVLDKMAKEGMKLTDFYSTCPVCTPSPSPTSMATA
jgi:arylsulfatase A-like enzyme